jgi:hypothetical protein
VGRIWTHCGAETDPRRVGSTDWRDTRGDAREKLERTIANSFNRTPREKEHQGSSSKKQDVQRLDRKDNGDLYRRYGREKQTVTNSPRGFERNILNTSVA